MTVFLSLAASLTMSLVSALSPPSAALSTLADLASDPPPAAIIRNSHYWVSNEYRHDVYRPTIADLGGVHIGVGTDQNYLLAGWSRPEVLVLMDFDGAIPRLHRIYRLMFRHAETPEAFVALWAPSRVAEVEGWIKAEYGDAPDLKLVLRAYRWAHAAVHGRLRYTARTYAKRGVPIWLTDAEQYAFVRGLWAAGRVFPVRGDLTGTVALRGISARLKEAGLVVRTLYLSNAEQYFDYGAAFRENIAGLPFDERSVVLHTLANGKFKKVDGHYHYAWQRGRDFQTNLGDLKVKKLEKLMRLRGRSTSEGVSQIVAAD